MPLIKSKSKKAFEDNMETEMKSGKPKAQSLAIAYSVKRKAPKKMAEGGPVSAKTEARPMPTSPGQKEVSRNKGNKPPKDDSWTSNVTMSQAQKPSKTPLSQPKMAAITGPFSVRSRDLHDDEAKMMDKMPPSSPMDEPPERDDEEDSMKMGSDPDMAPEHSTRRKPYAKGGMINEDVSMSDAEYDADEHPSMLTEDDDQETMPVDEYMAGHFAKGGMAHDMDDQPMDEEEEMEHAADIASAIMQARRSRMSLDSGSHDEDSAEMYADGGEVDIQENGEEHPNDYYHQNEDAVLKENYDSDFEDMSQPTDSNEHGDSEEAESENHDDKDVVSAIMRKMKKRSPITR